MTGARARGALKLGAILAPAAVLAALFFPLGDEGALAQNAECARLQQAIAARRSSGAEAAVQRQRAELGRARAYASSLGCNNRKFLFFGSNPPPQCGEVNARIAGMEANLGALQARAGGGVGDLVARYNAQCARGPSGPGNVFEALFGGIARLANGGEEPPPQMGAGFEDGSGQPRSDQPKPSDGGGARAGSYAVCVRTCDGSFFPVSYSGAGSRADSLEEVCRALCPNADMALYSFPFGGTIEQAVSPTGEPYENLPNAGKFEKTYDPNCSCRRKGESWAEALAGAEARYGHEKRDILVTPEKSLEMSRPTIDPKAKPALDAKGKPIAPDASVVAGPGVGSGGSPTDTTVLDANGAETKLGAEAATVSREPSGITGDVQAAKDYGVGQGKVVESVGPDGVKRTVRIVGPAL